MTLDGVEDGRVAVCAHQTDGFAEGKTLGVTSCGDEDRVTVVRGVDRGLDRFAGVDDQIVRLGLRGLRGG